ncbi:MAG: hypothetical protein FWH48_09385 [Oscillospiraceae bacterium]|nr:hypothetical protein [Oscillospiraceae bacterium]
MTMTKTAKTNQKVKIAKQKKAQKAQKRAIAEKLQKNKFGFMRVFVLFMLLALIFLKTWPNLISMRKNNEKLNLLKQNYNHERITTEYKKQKAEAPIDDDYIKEIAMEQDYWETDAVIYYFNESD